MMGDVRPAVGMCDLIRQRHAEARHRYDDALHTVSNCNRRVNELYHKLEVAGRLGGSDGYEYAKELQGVLIERRKAKWLVQDYGCVVQYLDATKRHFDSMCGTIKAWSVGRDEYLGEGGATTEASDVETT